MLCKIAEASIETENLVWQPVGRSSSGPLVERTQSKPQPSNLAAPGPAAPDQPAPELAPQRILELDQARQIGFEQGKQQARQEAQAEMESALDRLGRTIQELTQVKRKVRSEAENEIVKLSLAIARRILHRELTTDPQSLKGIVYAALQHLQNREVTRIRVFPGAVPAVKAALERNGGVTAIQIVADGALQPGGLIFETAVGELDASVDTQLQEIERGFADKLQLR